MSREKSKKVVLLYIACLFFLSCSLNRSVQAKTERDAATAPGKKVDAAVVVSGGGGLIQFMVTFAQSLFAPQSDKAESVTNESGYVGAEVCKTCHEDKYDSYIKTAMGNKLNPDTPAAKHECETCHGPGAAHVDAGGGKGVGGIKNPSVKSPLPVKEKNAICLQCHSTGNRALWQGSMHQSRGLSCTNCHSMHAGNPKLLAKPTQPETCTQCHKQIKAQIQKQSHHPIKEGKLFCTSCHNPHGTVTDKLLTANSVNEKCYECHTEKRGPFLWEHPPVTENCLTCHTPHGSSHNKLLVANPPYLCQTCHSGSRHPGTLYAQDITQAGQSVYVAAGNNGTGNVPPPTTTPRIQMYYRGCRNCHAQIHGSNHTSGEYFLR